jgi:hypothetical protein
VAESLEATSDALVTPAEHGDSHRARWEAGSCYFIGCHQPNRLAQIFATS